jgi:hypothetical protein
MSNYLTVDVIFSDGPPEWEGWPIGRSLIAKDHGYPITDLKDADRVELMIRRELHADDKDRSLVGIMTALVDKTDPPLVFVEGLRLDDEFSMAPLYFVVPASCVRRVISRVEAINAH